MKRHKSRALPFNQIFPRLATTTTGTLTATLWRSTDYGASYQKVANPLSWTSNENWLGIATDYYGTFWISTTANYDKNGCIYRSGPTTSPTQPPTIAPTAPTQEPTIAPTAPTVEPTSRPTAPTQEPTAQPTVQPTQEPTSRPTTSPPTVSRRRFM